MKPFVYERPADEAAALASASAKGALLLAGGTGVVDLMRLGVETPARLVDVSALDWSKIDHIPEGGIRIGALAKNTDVAYHPSIMSLYPALSRALLAGASPQIRNMASVGGNLAQRTRCAYFRDVAVPACNKRKPGSGCAALDGYTRMHAVLGGSSQCIAVHPSDMCVALAAFDAIVHIRGPAGDRAVAFVDFHFIPDDHPEVETTLAPGEMVTSIDLPPLGFSARSVYVKVRDRASYAFALASAAVALDLAGGVIRDSRVALGGIATKPWRSPEAETVLHGNPATTATFQRAAAAALESAKPRRGNDFKVELAKRVIVRALEEAKAKP